VCQERNELPGYRVPCVVMPRGLDYYQGMVISFLCPNGHKLKCPSSKAGQEGKCPKCSTRFQVPVPSAPEEAESTSTITLYDGITSAEEHPATGASGMLAGFLEGDNPVPPPSDAIHADTIVFLCPNGHKLNAPASLQGKPGKCPHCGERFLVPEIEEDAGSSGNYVDLNLSSESDQDTSTAAGESGLSSSRTLDLDVRDAGLSGPPSGGQAMSVLVARLWRQRGEHGELEVYLKGGERISPHWYAPSLSQSSVGMFAIREADGSLTITAIRWDAIDRVALRGFKQSLPGAFEG
jgi:hypothetical protein